MVKFDPALKYRIVDSFCIIIFIFYNLLFGSVKPGETCVGSKIFLEDVQGYVAASWSIFL